MPLIRIDSLAGHYTASQRAVMSEILYDAVRRIGAPEGDRFQIFTEHPPGHLVCDPNYLGIVHTEGFIAIQITLNAGRSLDQKKGLFSEIAERFESRAGVRRGDVFINLIEVPRENWSFGNGEAQYAPES